MSINKLMIKQRIHQEEMKLIMINEEKEDIENKIKSLQEQLEDINKGEGEDE